MKYFIADLHNYDNNIITYEHRPFQDVEEMRKHLIVGWNTAVNNEDDVYLLGDIGDPEILAELHGNIIIVAGNHDNVDELRNMYPTIEVSRYPIVVDSLILSHEPIGVMPPESPYLNIHGHIHSYTYGTLGTWGDGKRHFCVSVEQIGYRPISELEIAQQIEYTQCMRRKSMKAKRVEPIIPTKQ